MVDFSIATKEYFTKGRIKIIDAKLASGDIVGPRIRGVPYKITIKNPAGGSVVMTDNKPEVKRWFRKNALPVKLEESHPNGAIFTDLRNGTKFVKIKRGWLKVIMI